MPSMSVQMTQYEMDLFKAEMKARSEITRAEFGVPDEVVNGDELKMWRFTATVIPAEYTVFFNPTPVYMNDVLVGSANVVPADHGVFDAHVVVMFGLPERLDAENGKATELVVTKVNGRVGLRFK